MKKTTLLTGSLLTVAFVLFSIDAFTYRSGPTNGRSDSPTSMGTCSNAGCHSGGTNSGQTINVGHDIPSTGFEDNTTYSFVIDLDAGSPTMNRMGLHASIEDASGQVGTVAIGNSDVKVVDGYFISHTFNGSTGSNGQKSYSFTWTTPANAPANATLYIAANFANGNGNTSGDFIKTMTLPLTKSSIGIEENAIKNVKLFPNPASEFVEITGQLSDNGEVYLSIFDLNGKKVKSYDASFEPSGEFTRRLDISDLAKGIYMVMFSQGTSVSHVKLIVE